MLKSYLKTTLRNISPPQSQYSEQFGCKKSAFILNETAIRKIGWKTPEESISKGFRYGSRKGQIEGEKCRYKRKIFSNDCIAV